LFVGTEEAEGLREGQDGADAEEGEVLWGVGNDSDIDEDDGEDSIVQPPGQNKSTSSGRGLESGLTELEEGLMGELHKARDEEHGGTSQSSEPLF
jgi:hypothetical protein